MLKAEAVACSGAEVALHPSVKPGSPNLSGEFDNGAKYEARLTGEGGRLNVNWLVAGEDPNRMEILRRYLETKAIDLNEREAMVDALLDWVEPNTGLHHLNAPAESDDYRPAHALLTRIDQLKSVKGWGEFCARPDWDAELTVNSTGPIDLAWASRDLLMSLPGMNDQLVDAFLQLRAGPDAIEGTEDDGSFKSLEEVRAALGFTPEQFKQLAPLVSFKDQVVRITSVGRSGNMKRTVQMIVRKSGNMPQLINWKEI